MFIQNSIFLLTSHCHQKWVKSAHWHRGLKYVNHCAEAVDQGVPNYSPGATSHSPTRFYPTHRGFFFGQNICLIFDIFTHYISFLSLSMAGFLCNSHILFWITSQWLQKNSIKHVHSFKSHSFRKLVFFQPTNCIKCTMWPYYGKVWKPLL